MKNTKIITLEEARNFYVNYHNLNQARDFHGVQGVLDCFHQIKSIQYDPLNVVGRNADLVLQSRVKNYEPWMLFKALYENVQLVDGFDKEMCIYEKHEFSDFARIRQATGERVIGTLTYRGQLDILDILDEVREYVRNNGPISSKDLSIGESKVNRWGHQKLSSAALDYLYNTGELLVKEKKGVQKCYDLTERILPNESRQEDRFPSREDFLDWYIKRRISCVGMLWNKQGGAWQGHYLSNTKEREQVLHRLCKKGELREVTIEGIPVPFYCLEEAVHFFDTPVEKSFVRFLAPLDNLLWDRELVKKIFDFEYRWEVYTPVIKRKYGYYVLPVLYKNQIIARFEPEKSKQGIPFSVKNWWWEPGVIVSDDMMNQIHVAMKEFARYLGVPIKEIQI